MSLARNSTEYAVSNNHGNSSEELDTPLNNSTASTTFNSTMLSLWSSLSTTLEGATTSAKSSSILHNTNNTSTLSAGLRFTLFVKNPNSSTTSKGIPTSPVTSSTPLPVSKFPRWRKKTTLFNTTTTTHMTTTQRHVTTQSLSTIRRSTLTTTATMMPSAEDHTVLPSTGSTPTQTVTSIRVTENFSNVTYVSRDVIEGKKETGNSTVTPQRASENPNKPSGYNQSIITPLVTPLVSLTVNGGQNNSEKTPNKHSETKMVSNSRGGAIYPENRPISYWRPKDHSDVHITEALLNNTAREAPVPPEDINQLLLPDMDEDIPVAEPLIHRPYDVPLVSSTAAASSTSSTSASSSTTEITLSTVASSSASYLLPSLATSSSHFSISNQTSIVTSSTTQTSKATTSATSSATSTKQSSTQFPMSSVILPSTIPTEPSSPPSSSSLAASTSQATRGTPSSTLAISSSMKPIYTELWLSLTNRPTISSTERTTQPTTNKQTSTETSTTTTASTKMQSSSTSQSKAPSASTSLTTRKNSAAQNQEAVSTKSSEGHTTSERPTAVNFTEPPFGDFLGPRPSFDPPKEEHTRSVDLVNNRTDHRGPPTDHTVLPPSSTPPTRSKKPLGVAKPTVYSTTTPVNLTLEKMVVGPVSKPSNTNMAAIVVPVLLVMIMAGVGALFFFRKRCRVTRNNQKSRKESMDVTTPLHVDLEQCSPIDSGPVYAKVDLSKKTRRVNRSDYTAVQCHERPLSDEATLLSSADADFRMNRIDRSSTSEESLAPGLEAYCENDLKIEDDRSLESIPGHDDNDYFDYMDYTQGGARVVRKENDRDSGAILDQSGDSPLRLPLLAPPVPSLMPNSDHGSTSDSDFEEVQSPDNSGSCCRSSILEDYSEPRPTPPRTTSSTRPHFYDQVYIPISAINNFVDSTNYVKGRKRSDSVHTNPYEEIGPAGGATGRGPVPSTSGLGTSGFGRGMAIYATVDETRMDGRPYALPTSTRGYSSPPDMSTAELSNWGNQGASASPTLGPLLPTKRAITSFRGPPLLLSRRRSRRRRTRSLPPRSRGDNPPSLPDRPSTPRRPTKMSHDSNNNPNIPDYVTSRSLDLLDSGCCDVDLDVPVPPSDDSVNPPRVLLPPALPERTQLPPKTPPPVTIRDRPLPDPEAKNKQRPIPDRTSTTARTVDLERMVTYDIDLDSIVPPSREDLQDSFAPLVWLTSPEPRYSGLLCSEGSRDGSVHQYTSLEAIPGTSRNNRRAPRPNSLSSSKSEGHLDRTSTSSTDRYYLDINCSACPSNTVLPSPGGFSDQSENRSPDYESVYTPPRDPIYESVGNPSAEK